MKKEQTSQYTEAEYRKFEAKMHEINDKIKESPFFATIQKTMEDLSKM